MQRSWQLTLPIANTWYNLWTLITQDPSFTDHTFTTGVFVPSMVSECNIQANNVNISISEDTNQEVGLNITVGSSYRQAVQTNAIDLKAKSIKSQSNGAIINVAIVAF